MEEAITKGIEYVFTQGAGYITLAACFSLFYYDQKKYFKELIQNNNDSMKILVQSINDNLKDQKAVIEKCHERKF